MKLGHGLGFAVRRIFTSSSLPNNLIAYWNMSSTAASVGGASMTLNGINNGNFFDSTAPLINSQYLRPSSASYSQRTNSTLSLNWSGNFTLNFWFRMTNNDALNANGRSLISIGVDALNTGTDIIINNPGDGGFITFGETQDGVLGASYLNGNLVSLTDGVWRMITIIHSANGTMTGIVNANRALNDANISSVSKTGIESDYIQFCRSFFSSANTAINANIDETGIWNRALTDAEITQLYNAGTGKFYPFS